MPSGDPGAGGVKSKGPIVNPPFSDLLSFGRPLALVGVGLDTDGEAVEGRGVRRSSSTIEDGGADSRIVIRCLSTAMISGL